MTFHPIHPIIQILFIFLMAIIFVLALLHFYWAQGGQLGFRKALPEKENGELLFLPTKIHSAIVGIGLLGILGLWYFRFSANLFNPYTFSEYGLWIVGILFILRAIGDFKYVGFFKKIRKTEFGQLDTKFYSPLCLLIGISTLLFEHNIPPPFISVF